MTNDRFMAMNEIEVLLSFRTLTEDRILILNWLIEKDHNLVYQTIEFGASDLVPP
ncbi:MAG: hypothetical protein Harvfovirus29_3 [Harvfovirus sp.]|uniref:Uncharacterized protein n=1 Tax=Harvfovirus sp. TaxID=2487768 RepID=A0A3G5A4E2_9VIRU|nr:MAG: hypothetical protein Harvfovirus29_3 [Harvfovirus sp.]